MRLPFSRVAVSGDSMRPTLRPGDWLLVRRTRRVRPGDLVVLRRPDRPELIVVKRVAGRTADGRWWVRGDNSSASDDSRLFGPVPVDAVLGRVALRYWPPRSAR